MTDQSEIERVADTVPTAQADDRAQMLQDFMEQHHGRCLRASEWDAIVKFLATQPAEPAADVAGVVDYAALFDSLDPESVGIGKFPHGDSGENSGVRMLAECIVYGYGGEVTWNNASTFGEDQVEWAIKLGRAIERTLLLAQAKRADDAEALLRKICGQADTLDRVSIPALQEADVWLAKREA